ncbi:MAG: hypothetical protein J7621_05500 [Niastella sp.]|nr:hypothetical protein [Niastella sp.]
MNLLRRIARSLITILPSLLPGLGLGWYAWRTRCFNIQCKSLLVVLLLTAAVLVIWSLIVLVLSLLENDPIIKTDTWGRFRVNLLDITPNVLLHAAIFGVMLYTSAVMIVSNIDTSNYKQTGSLYLIAVFAVPVYELTRIFERKKSVAPPEGDDDVARVLEKKVRVSRPSWKVYAGIYLQTVLTFGIWYGIMLLILQGRILAGQAYNKSWDIPLLVVMAGVSFLLVKFFKRIESQLRAKGAISWDSSYF